MDYAIVLGDIGNNSEVDYGTKLLGKPMLSYILDTLKATKVEKTIGIVGIQETSKMEVFPKELHTALEEIREDGITLFIPVNVPFINSKTLNQMLELHKKKNHTLTLGTMLSNEFHSFGVVKRKNRKIVEIGGKNPSEKLMTEIFTGIFCITNSWIKEALSYGKILKIQELIEYVSKKDRVHSFMLPDSNARGIFDLGSLVFAEEKYREQLCLSWIKKNVRMENYKSVLIGPDVWIAEGVTIYANTRILGKTKICKGANIGPNTTLQDSFIEENASIRDSVIENSIIHPYEVIGPYAVKIGYQKVEE